jgi:hypothetical protein
MSNEADGVTIFYSITFYDELIDSPSIFSLCMCAKVNLLVVISSRINVRY